MIFEEIPVDINILIVNRLNHKDLYNLMLVNKYFFINFFDIFIEKKKDYLKSIIPSHIFSVIENYDFNRIKYLDFREEFIGLDYIDRIKIDDVDSPIMFSIDCFNRPMLSFMINLKSNNSNFDIIHTMFQRYTGYKNSWVFGTCYGTFKIHNQAVPSAEVLLNYKNLVENKTLDIDNYKVSLG